ncbi:MAG: heparinase II/III-family protein, partial [Bacteroidetes bacterium]|nr:heparinase II/III-family protein [Bacteroidota bacterium]
GLIGAIKYNQPELPEMLASMKKLIDGGMYRREHSGFLGLLCFIPDLPEAKTTYQWPHTGTLDFARYFLQRNGTDPQTGLMVGVQGATYNHNHCNGMAMELYGLGEVMGIDAGTGPNYEHPLHRNYYSQWAAHNTVVAAGASSSVPFSGSAGAKNIGQIELAAMEPMPDKAAVSPVYSFTDTRYLDKSTNTNEARTLAIVRTSPTTGYYIDIYRSDNKISNDYVYHNIGDGLTFLNSKREQLKTLACDYPRTDKDYPGFRFFTNVE